MKALWSKIYSALIGALASPEGAPRVTTGMPVLQSLSQVVADLPVAIEVKKQVDLRYQRNISCCLSTLESSHKKANLLLDHKNIFSRWQETNEELMTNVRVAEELEAGYLSDLTRQQQALLSDIYAKYAIFLYCYSPAGLIHNDYRDIDRYTHYAMLLDPENSTANVVLNERIMGWDHLFEPKNGR